MTATHGCMQPMRGCHQLSGSVTAELLTGAGALSLADRHHFELNLSDLLDKLRQCKRNWLLNVVATRQRFERQQANFEGIQNLSAANSKLTKWMIAGRASQWTPSTLSLTGHILVPSQPGPKTPFLQSLCDHSEWSSHLLMFPTTTMRAMPCNPHTKPATSLSKMLQQDRSTH